MTRLCFLCGKKIGFFRSMADQQYCSAAHRHEARLASSQVLREEEETETWSVEKSRNKKKAAGATKTTAGQTASVFAFLTVGGLLVAALMLPSSGPSTNYPPTVSLDSGVKQGFLERAGGAISELIRSSAPVTLHQDFHSGLGDWATLAVRSTVDDPRNWVASASAEVGRGSSLRLWEKSVLLQNYQMEFKGQIERRSLNWAFRASDQNNYYATRLVMTKPGPLPNASLLRYVVMNGQEFEKSTLPVPMTLEKGMSYDVRVTVQDNLFVTYVNGQPVNRWVPDRKLRRGGIGFIMDEDDPQQVAWVDVSEHDSFLGRMLAHFSFFVVPPGFVQ